MRTWSCGAQSNIFGNEHHAGREHDEANATENGEMGPA